MNPYKFTYPEQAQIYQRLTTLIGPGAAAFYQDACRLMEMDPPLESTTHLVGHLLREVESSLRAVLKSVQEQSVEIDQKETHKSEIRAALQILGISEKSDAAKDWLKLPGRNSDGLHKHAHRDDLSPPRKVTEDFQTFWRGMNELLKTILERMETCATSIHARLDSLLVKKSPTKQDIDILRLEIPNSTFGIGYFFNYLESSTWLQPLYEKGFFNYPSEIEIDSEGKTFRFPVWEQSRYLVKVASDQSELVLEIALKLFDKDSSNIRIYEDLVEASLEMPSELATRFTNRAINWLKQQTYLYYPLPDKFGKLIIHLASEEQLEVAIEVAKELLTLLPSSDGDSLEKVIPRFDRCHYGKVVQDVVTALTEKRSHSILIMLSELLDQYLSSSYSSRDGQFFEDHSYYWMQNLEVDIENLCDINCILASEIWKLTKQICEQDPCQSRNLHQYFATHRWRIFDRFSLDLLRLFPDPLSDLITDRLINRDRLEWLGLYSEGIGLYYAYEHALLLREQFANIKSNEQENILRWLLESPLDIVEIEEEKQEKYRKYWRRDWLSIISNHLPLNLKKIYDELVQELGEPNSLDSIFADTRSRTQNSSNSPKSGSELSEMAEGDMNALFDYLKKWEPSRNILRQSRNDLAWELAEQVIVPSPQKFVYQIERFKELDSEFMVWFLRGLMKALKKMPGEEFVVSWEPVLEFCAWMPDNLKDNYKATASNSCSEWSRICDSVVEIIDIGLQVKGVNSIPLSLRKQVWQILESLTIDRQLTPGFTSEYQGSNMDAYGVSINTVRGKAMHAIVRYASWIRVDVDGNLQVSQNFDDMPEVQNLLEWHLNPQQDPSLAIRAIYGYWFPLLHCLASDWALQRIDQIFPETPNENWLFKSAWEGYEYNQLYAVVFNVLRKKHIHAIEQIPSLWNSISSQNSNTMKALTDHVFMLFWSSLVDLNEPDKLIENFFLKAPKSGRQGFMQSLSWRLLYGEFNVDNTLHDRLQHFLEWRISQANIANNAQQYTDLKYFSWIVASGKLDDSWSIDKLLNVLQLIGTVDYCEEFLERLENLALIMSEPVIECLSLIADGKSATEWFVSYHSNHYHAIFKTALECVDENTKKSARELINRLLARSLGDYRELL